MFLCVEAACSACSSEHGLEVSCVQENNGIAPAVTVATVDGAEGVDVPPPLLGGLLLEAPLLDVLVLALGLTRSRYTSLPV